MTRLTELGFSHKITFLSSDNAFFFVDECSSTICPPSATLFQIVVSADSVQAQAVCRLKGGYNNACLKIDDQHIGISDIKTLNNIYTRGDCRVGEYPSDIQVSTNLVPFQIPLSFNVGGFELYGRVLLPRATDRPLPLLMFLYNGPKVQLVTNSFNVNRRRFRLLLELGFMIYFFDGRGTHNRNVEFETCLSGNLYEAGVEDVGRAIEAVAQIGEQRTRTGHTGWSVDLGRIVTFGWSFGGYLAVQSLLAMPTRIRMAISCCAPTDWALYDTAYTERYLDIDPHILMENSTTSRVAEFPDE
jgi:hypothetical protein